MIGLIAGRAEGLKEPELLVEYMLTVHDNLGLISSAPTTTTHRQQEEFGSFWNYVFIEFHIWKQQSSGFRSWKAGKDF